MAIDINGEYSKVSEFLQSQVTSDIKMINTNEYQLSSICNHKGQLMAGFVLNNRSDGFRIIVKKYLVSTIKDELMPFAKFHQVSFSDNLNKIIGIVSKPGKNSHNLLSNNDLEIGISMEKGSYDKNNEISIDIWNTANKILGNYELSQEDIGKFRPLEINYDNFRTSFEKGCYRGQEIVARMKYLGVDRRLFCTIISQTDFSEDKNIKLIGKKITVNNVCIFNAIIKRDDLEKIKHSDGILKILLPTN